MSQPVTTPAQDDGAALNGRVAASVLGALAAGGVRRVILSPGSRSTPLVLAAEAHPELTTHVVLDERVAGFVGLGVARTSGEPVALVCTSGSAAGHYLPAVMEARAAGLPLVILTADRPAELHAAGAPQTCDQRGLYGAHAVAAEHVAAEAPVRPGWLRQVVARLLDASRRGPVQLNIAFRKPLWAPAAGADEADPAAALPWVVRAAEAPRIPAALLSLLRSARQGAIVCGPRACGAPGADVDRFRRAVSRLATLLGWPILAEPASQLRHGPHDRSRVVACADLLLRDPAFAAARTPDVVLRFGQTPTSSAVQAWLAAAAPATVLVDPAARWHDPTHTAFVAGGGLLVGDPAGVAERLAAALANRGPQPSDSLDAWLAADAAAREVLGELPPGTWEGPLVRALAEGLPEGTLLCVASSLAIRDLDAYSGTSPRRLRVAASRGLNGIDGTLASTWGAALAWEGPVALLCGDLAFLHDLGGLAAARGLGARGTVVVVDNRGGGIFDALPIAAHPTAHERAFVTPHDHDLVALARACGVAAERVETPAALAAALAASPDAGAPALRVLVVPVDRAASGAARAEAVRSVVAALAARDATEPASDAVATEEARPAPEEVAPCPASS